MAMSFMTGKGLSTTQLLNLVVNTLYDKFVEKDIKGFDGFNVGILDTFNTINMALPGKHFVAPSYKDVKELFEQWKEIDTEEKRKKFIKFIIEKVNINKVDESMLITAIMAPPAAMMAKKTGQIVPQLALMNAIPDVVFVPSATILALIAVKIIRLTFIRKTTSKDTVSYITEIEEKPQIKTKQQPQIPTTPETEVEEPQTEQQPQTPTTPKTEVEEPQTEQQPQTPTAPETEVEEPQTEQPQTPTTSETKVEEHEIESEQESQTPTRPKIESIQEPLTITTFETKIEEESQTTATPETLKEEPQSGTEIKKELQSQTTNVPETAIQGPQIPIQQKPHFITGHVHKDNTTCFLCNEYHIY
ncbi:integumentary mucin A.1-like [Vigna umbellata]|uniref:integumentary mucin A.1-like n=1 Tax=Vigna umbellata TaxID=87088 RepID=UPI001F5E7FCE|nr:integumentary mucin A.1-like [Vigna umbellata]